MEQSRRKAELPPIPAKRYFTIGEVSELCGVKPHVLRYWEQEFTQLKPVKRRGNRRYYQHHEVLLIRRIRQLLYEEGFTISGAKKRLETEMAGRGNTPQSQAAAVVQSEETVDDPTRKALQEVRETLREILTLLERNDRKQV
ncbi:MAG: MerR family transcriptional regulator [Gammaproteobacteria bacterium]